MRESPPERSFPLRFPLPSGLFRRRLGPCHCLHELWRPWSCPSCTFCFLSPVTILPQRQLSQLKCKCLLPYLNPSHTVWAVCQGAQISSFSSSVFLAGAFLGLLWDSGLWTCPVPSCPALSGCWAYHSHLPGSLKGLCLITLGTRPCCHSCFFDNVCLWPPSSVAPPCLPSPGC